MLLRENQTSCHAPNQGNTGAAMLAGRAPVCRVAHSIQAVQDLSTQTNAAQILPLSSSMAPLRAQRLQVFFCGIGRLKARTPETNFSPGGWRAAVGNRMLNQFQPCC